MIPFSEKIFEGFLKMGTKKDTALRQCLYVAGVEPAVILIR